MKKIAFVYSKMIVGGSTTALLAYLNHLNYSKYDVDLILFYAGGELFDDIPKQVHVKVLLETPAAERKLKLRKMLSPAYVTARKHARRTAEAHRNPLLVGQMLSEQYVKLLPAPEKEYDTVCSFLEFSPTAYAAFRMKARRRIAWIHPDYAEAGLLGGVENRAFERIDHLVFVSPSCEAGFRRVYPEFADKTTVIENFVDAELLIRKSRKQTPLTEFDPEQLDRQSVHIVSSSRIEFASKGYDRAVRVFEELVRNQESGTPFHWYVIGDGPDLPEMKRMVHSAGLSNAVTFLGEMKNPFPVIKEMDFFLLPSRREGKPIAVTEAMMLGVPPLVTWYQSAPEQIRHMSDGIIVENQEEALHEGLRLLLNDRTLLKELSEKVQNTDYMNYEPLHKLEALLKES